MRDRRGERRHRKNVKRRRWMAYHQHNGGGSRHGPDGRPMLSNGRQGSVRTLKSAQWVGRVPVLSSEDEARKARRARWHAANRIQTAARLMARAADRWDVEVSEL